MPRQENTKELFIIEALKLFAERGYDQVKISDIARAVGCVPSALYKHYENKEQLYEAMLADSIKGFAESMQMLQTDFIHDESLRLAVSQMTEEQQVKKLQDLLTLAIQHEQAKNFRKLMTVEQFRKPELAKIYNERYVMFPVDQQEAVFKIWMECGILAPGDAQSLAIMYIAPLTVMIELCDREPDKFEWALNEIERHVKAFNRVFRLK